MGERGIVSFETERFWSDVIPYWAAPPIDLPRILTGRPTPEPTPEPPRKRGRATGLPQPRGSP